MKAEANVSDYQLKSILTHSILDLHILPTEKCNFRCIYCYEDFLIGKMPNHVINGVKNLINKRMPELKQLRISWFGGEPLAATRIVLEISQYAKNLAEQYHCNYSFGMTTNGYLLDNQKFESIINAGIRSFQISLDGSQEYHDKTRLRADGSGTFDKIWHNLADMARTNFDFDIILRVHVTPENHVDVAILLDKIKSTFKSDSRFKVFLKAIANLGGPNRGSFDVLTGKSKEQIITQLNQILGKDINNHELHKPDAPYICYASAQNA